MSQMTRHLVQLYSALLYNAHLKGFIEGEIYQGKTKSLCVPGFNCYSCPGAVGACPLGSLQNALASSGHRAGWYIFGILLLYGVILGRTVCGWLCPLGLLQELLHKIPTPKIRKSRITRALSWLKYVILGVFVIALPLWYGIAYDVPLPGFCKYICPAGTFEGAMGLLPVRPSLLDMLGILFTRKFVILVVIVMACIFCYRSFCRFLCPLGAIYGLFNRFNLIGVKVDAGRCNHCGACVRSCGMDVRHVGDHECINCGKCMESCRQGAISIKAGGFTLKAPEMGCAGDDPGAPARRKKAGRIAAGIALAVLCFALLWYNILDPYLRNRKEGADAPTVMAPADSSDSQGGSLKKEDPDLQGVVLGQTEEADRESTASAQTEADGGSAASAQTEADRESTASAQTEADSGRAASAQTEADSGSAPSKDASAFQSDAPIGREVGQQLEDFTAECFDGSTFHLADERGKVVFLNLWATYCTPCVQELPYFSDLYRKYDGEVAVLAVHSSLVAKDDPATFIEGRDLAMPFTTDTKENTIFTIVGGSSTLPQTIVLNRKGEVVYNKTGPVTPEMLEELYQEAGRE